MSFTDDLIEKHFGKKRRIMRELALDEISAVTVPAQKGARAVIMKSADAAAEPFGKGVLMTEPTAGHAHLLELTDYVRMQGGGFTEPSGSNSDGVASHRHPFIVRGNGEIVIGESNGHAHAMAGAPATSKGANTMKVMTENEVRKALSGAGIGKGVSSPAVEKLDEMARKRQEAIPTETYAQAYAKVIETPAGSALYEQTI
jgi:hypothetical protein